MSSPRMKPKWKGMCVVASFSPEEVLPLRGDYDRTFTIGGEDYTVHMDSARYRVFAQSLMCAECGVVGVTMRLEFDRAKHSQGGIPHFNLYAFVNGVYRLMTKDHIVPKSLGGKDHDDNYRTMCTKCNEHRGNKLTRLRVDREAPEVVLL